MDTSAIVQYSSFRVDLLRWQQWLLSSAFEATRRVSASATRMRTACVAPAASTIARATTATKATARRAHVRPEQFYRKGRMIDTFV